MTFDFDEWPSTHTDDEKYIRAYNGSIFDLRSKYKEIFFEPEFDEINEDEGIDSSTIFKIKYTLNLITDFTFHIENDEDGSGNTHIVLPDTHLVETLEHTDELDIFNT